MALNNGNKTFPIACLALAGLLWTGTFLLWSDAWVGRPDPLSERRQYPEATSTAEIVNLPVPFTSQAPEQNWDQPWQDACEEAAMLMLDAYHKGYGVSPLFARDEILKMVAWQDARGWEYSISMEQIRQFAEEYLKLNGTVRVIENPGVNDIKRLLAEGKPILAVADGKALPNPYFRNGGPVYHALIIRGYTDDSFITNDPGTRLGENFLYRYDDLLNAIRDWNGGDVKHGERVVLVVE
jgi:hypothetical protein